MRFQVIGEETSVYEVFGFGVFCCETVEFPFHNTIGETYSATELLKVAPVDRSDIGKRHSFLEQPVVKGKNAGLVQVKAGVN